MTLVNRIMKKERTTITLFNPLQWSNIFIWCSGENYNEIIFVYLMFAKYEGGKDT